MPELLSDLLTRIGASSTPGRTLTWASAASDILARLNAAFAPLASPVFTGTPQGPTQSVGDNSTKLATTAYVDRAAASGGGGGASAVQSVAGKTGVVTLVVGDVAGAAPLASPVLTGAPQGPTQSAGDGSTKLATTAYADRGDAAAIARTQVSDAAYAILATDRTVAVIALTAARVLSLPAASAYPRGATLTVVDESGACSSLSTLTLACAGSDTVNGATSAVLSAPYAYLALQSNGAAKWTVVDQSSGAVSTLNGGPLAGNRNKIVNGNFAINQRAQASGVGIPANVYGHDRWKAGAGTVTYAFTSNGIDTTINITAGSICQVVDAGNIEGGTYILSWTGSAIARVYQGAASGYYVASPIVVRGVSPGVALTVELASGTATCVQLEPGIVATPFERRLAAVESLICQRYYYRRLAASNRDVIGMMSAYSATGAWGKMFDLPAEMRAAPTISYSNLSHLYIWNAAGAPYTPTALDMTYGSSPRSVSCYSGLTAPSGAGFSPGQALFLTFQNTAGWIDASAEL